MSGRPAIWLLAFVTSLAVHSGIVAGLVGMVGTPGPPAAAELLIGDEAAFSALVVNPVTAETGSAEKIAESNSSLAPIGNPATATNEAVKKEIYAPAEEAISQPLPRIAQEDSSAPVQAPEALAPVPEVRVETKAVAGSVIPMPDAQAISPASDQPRIGRVAAGSSKLQPNADDRRLASIAEHRELVTPSPAFEPKQVQGDKEINSAEPDAIVNSPVMAESASPSFDGDRLPSVAESQTQPGQSPEQAILAPAAESTGASAPVESGVEIGQPPEQATSKAVVASEQANAPVAEDGARQNLSAVAEALAPEKIGSAQSLPPAGESTQSARLESEAPRISAASPEAYVASTDEGSSSLSAVPEKAGGHVASITTGGEHERAGLAVGGGQTLKAAEAEDKPVASAPVQAPEALAPVPEVRVETKAVAGSVIPMPDAQAISPASDQPRSGRVAAGSSKLQPNADDRRLASIAEHRELVTPSPAFEPKQVQGDKEINSAEPDAIVNSPVMAESASPSFDGDRLPSVAESQTQPGQSPEQAILAPAAKSIGASAPVESAVEIGQPPEQATSKAVVASEQANAPVAEDGARQNLSAVAEALAPEKIGSAQSLPPAGESTKSARLESEAPRISAASPEAYVASTDEGSSSLSAVPEKAGEHVASIATGGEHERPGLAVGGGQALKAAEAEDRPIAPTATNSPIHVPVDQIATQSPFSLPDPVESQPQAASTIVAQAAPHPAIELPPTHVLPDDPTFRMANFIRDYDGGFCFLAAPDLGGSGKPQIEAYGSRFDLFRSFNEAFRRAFGVDPVLGERQIREPQCAAIGFIGKVLKSRSPEIAVRLESDSVPSGSEIKGALEGIRLSHVTLLFVDDDGMVHDVSRFLRRTVDGFEFSAPVYPTREGKLRNQLVVAVAADRKLGFAKTDFTMSGSAYFSSMIRQADASGAEISIGVGAFRIE